MNSIQKMKRAEIKNRPVMNACLMDDRFFTAVLDHYPEVMGEILNTLFGWDIAIERVTVQETIPNLNGKESRCDVIAVEKTGDLFLTEIENNIQRMEPKRMGFLAGRIIGRTIEKGEEDWKKVRHGYVIMFCSRDYFGKGEPAAFSRVLFNQEERDIGIKLVYVNCTYQGNDAIGRLAHDMMCRNTDEIYNKTIRECVRKTKEEEMDRMARITEEQIEEAMRKIEKDSIIRGRKEERAEMKNRLMELLNKYDPENQVVKELKTSFIREP